MKIWVVGANTGLGAAIAMHGVHVGHDMYRTGVETDVRDWDAIEAYAKEHGPFEGVVYSAGVASLGWIADIDQKELERVFAINVHGFLGVMRALTMHQDQGRVVALASDSSRTPMRGSVAYCASKAAEEMAVKVAARELAPAWQVNAVSPSAVDGTAMTEWIDEAVPRFRNWTPEEARNYELAGIPMKRRARIDEVVWTVYTLLDSPTFMTGSVIGLTGGK